MYWDNNKITSNNSGSILFETLIIIPVLIFISLFCVDFLSYTKAQTFITQIVRDSGIFFATVPDHPTPNQTFVNLHSNGEYSDCLQICEATNFQSEVCHCFHYATHERIFRAIQSDSSTLDMESLNIETSFDPLEETVSINVTIEKKLTFFWSSKKVESKATLLKVNL